MDADSEFVPKQLGQLTLATAGLLYLDIYPL